MELKIYNKSWTKHVKVRIADPKEMRSLMDILAKNDIPFLLAKEDLLTMDHIAKSHRGK